MTKYSDMIKQADEARNRMVANRRQAVANGTATPYYRDGDWNRLMENAPLAAQVLNPALYTDKSTWSHTADVAKGVTKGMVAGTNALGQSGLSMLQGAVDNRFISSPNARQYLENVKNGLSDVNKEWQTALGSYDAPNRQSGSMYQNLINNPGQSMQRFFTGWVPAVASTAMLNGAGKAVGAVGEGAATAANAVLPRLGTAGKAALNAGKNVNKYVKAWSNFIPNANKAIDSRVPAALRGAAKSVVNWLPTAGAVAPIVDKTTGIFHVNPDDNSFVAGAKNVGRKLIPYLAFTKPSAAFKTMAMRNPALQEGATEGMTRGMLESSRDTVSNNGIAGDYIEPAASAAIKYGPESFAKVYNGVKMLDPDMFTDGFSAQDAGISAAMMAASNAKGISPRTREALRRDSLRWVNEAPYNRVMGFAGLQETAQPAVKQVSNVLQGAPDYAGAIRRGISGAVANDPSLKTTMYGKGREQDTEAAIAASRNAFNTYKDNPRDVKAALASGYDTFMQGAAPETAGKVKDFSEKVVRGIPNRVDGYLRSKLPPDVMDAIDRAKDVYSEMPDWQRGIMRHGAAGVARKVYDNMRNK